jgi:hypothetical protein
MLANNLTAGSFIALAIFFSVAYAADPVVPQQETEIAPLKADEIQNGLKLLAERQNQRIEEWGKTLKPDDFERSWISGRQLKKNKRQEVCGIFQRTVDDAYKGALANRNRLNEADQKLLDDRNAFIGALGYQNNIVDTQMGFNCRLK